MASQDYKYYICYSNIFCVCSISLLIPVSHHTIIYLFFHADPNNPPCMRFYTYMAGRGVGRLRVMLEDVVTRKQKIMWALQGHQGTRWVQGQLPLSSGVPFKASQYFLCPGDLDHFSFLFFTSKVLFSQLLLFIFSCTCLYQLLILKVEVFYIGGLGGRGYVSYYCWVTLNCPLWCGYGLGGDSPILATSP